MVWRLLVSIGLVALFTQGAAAQTKNVAVELPRYDLDINLDIAKRLVSVRETVTWTNNQNQPTRQLVFNAHSHYSVPDKDVGFLAKTLELLRLSPTEALSFEGPPLEVEHVCLPGKGKTAQSLTHYYSPDNDTALVIELPDELKTGESITVEIGFQFHIPAKKGRWSQWDSVTALAQWLPVVAVYDEKGWNPTPFIPWHQPFYNEAGVYTARIVLASDQKLACSASFEKVIDLRNGCQEIVTAPICVRDFALVSSNHFEEYHGQADGVDIRVLALPEHAYYGKAIVKYLSEAIPAYNRWFGHYPYPQFTIAEAYFGWNGNECGGLVMIDARMFGMPHMTESYIDYLVSHELCHQWWYNVVGTNGYAETWMDEGLATYFSHRLIDQKRGKDNNLLSYPPYLEWLPNIARDDFRNYGYVGARARGAIMPTVQDMPAFGHLANLSAMTYDRGSRIVGIIEDRLGEAAFLDFMRGVYRKYRFRILHVADFQRELEAYTGHSWEEFFHNWLYGAGCVDWAVDHVEINREVPRVVSRLRRQKAPVTVVVHLRRKGDFDEPTVLGIRLDNSDNYQIRVPLIPDVPVMDFEDLHARVINYTAPKRGLFGGPPLLNAIESVVAHAPVAEQEEKWTRVEITLPCEPTQISVDPDRVLLDSDTGNNHWKPVVRWRLTPLYTQLEETDVTNRYHCWNIIAGPWVYTPGYNDPWYQKSSMAGVRAAVYRTQQFDAGVYAGYRSNDRNLIAGVDVLWDHVPLPNTQIGINVERSLSTLNGDPGQASRGVLFGRYILMNGSSLYLPPFEYVETFATAQYRTLPEPRWDRPGTDPFDTRTALGLHYHKNLLTPYWDPEGGIALDGTYEWGLPIFGSGDFQQLFGQVSIVKHTPDPFGILDSLPLGDWLKSSRWAVRLGGAAALPQRGLFFALGGGDQFRGFDLAARQGSLTWVGSVEWRMPVLTNLKWDVCDHLAGIRNIYIAPFYDVGDAYANGHSFGPVAHAFGAGLRVDVTWLGLIERNILRFDVAKAINIETPTQFWFGLEHPF